MVDLKELLCVGCKHFMPVENKGECRKHAPILVAGRFGTFTEWPETHAGNWCGDHEQEEG